MILLDFVTPTVLKKDWAMLETFLELSVNALTFFFFFKCSVDALLRGVNFRSRD